MQIKYIKATVLLFILIVSAAIYSNPLTPLENFKIVLSWSSFGAELEAVLIIPDPESGVGYPLRGSLPAESPNGYVVAGGDLNDNPEITKEIFTIRKFTPGIYQIWVKKQIHRRGLRR